MAEKTSRAERHIALLRGINLAGKNRLTMKELTALFVEAGCRDVETYIQSGNVVYTATPALHRRVPSQIASAIEKRFGLRVPVVTRTAGELKKVAGGNPFLQAGVDPGKLHVVFLADRPSAAKAAGLDPRRSPPDELVVLGREIYLHCPGGIGESKLTNVYFDRQLDTVSTARNWKTVSKLAEMVGAR
jgi:uncharacterized protein (DUF1697 family)